MVLGSLDRRMGASMVVACKTVFTIHMLLLLFRHLSDFCSFRDVYNNKKSCSILQKDEEPYEGHDHYLRQTPRH